MANLYTTSDAVRAELPDDPGGTALTDETIGCYIADRSRYVDDSLPDCAGFPDVAGTPATPPLIERITRFLAAYDCMAYLGILRQDGAPSAALRDEAERTLEKLRRGEMVISGFDYSGKTSRENMKQTRDEYYSPAYISRIERE